MIGLEQGSLALHIDGSRLEPTFLEKRPVGFCHLCQSELHSLAYHRTESGWLICARCESDHLVLMRYDHDWNWQGDQELQLISREGSVSSLSRDKLEQVFTPAEIRDMLAYEKGLPFVRQNLYRARSKFQDFERLFGIRPELKGAKEGQ